MTAARATLPPTVRSPRTRRVNRLAIGGLGLLLFAGGGAGLAAGLGAFGDAGQRRSVLDAAATYAHDHTWVWVAVGVAGALLAALALAWLAAQMRTNRLGDLDLSDEPRRGRTTLDPGAVGDAVGTEIEGYPGVRDASARLVTERGRPTLLVFAALDGRADAREVRERIQADAVPHARTALEDPDLPARLELRLSR